MYHGVNRAQSHSFFEKALKGDNVSVILAGLLNCMNFREKN